MQYFVIHLKKNRLDILICNPGIWIFFHQNGGVTKWVNGNKKERQK